MLTEKIWIFTRIYKKFYPSFSPICYYSFIFGLLRIFIGLSVFGFVANKYQQIAIWLLSTICTFRSASRWVIRKVILNHSHLPIQNKNIFGQKKREKINAGFHNAKCQMPDADNQFVKHTTSEWQKLKARCLVESK